MPATKCRGRECHGLSSPRRPSPFAFAVAYKPSTVTFMITSPRRPIIFARPQNLILSVIFRDAAEPPSRQLHMRAAGFSLPGAHIVQPCAMYAIQPVQSQKPCSSAMLAMFMFICTIRSPCSYHAIVRRPPPCPPSATMRHLSCSMSFASRRPPRHHHVSLHACTRLKEICTASIMTRHLSRRQRRWPWRHTPPPFAGQRAAPREQQRLSLSSASFCRQARRFNGTAPAYDKNIQSRAREQCGRISRWPAPPRAMRAQSRGLFHTVRCRLPSLCRVYGRHLPASPCAPARRLPPRVYLSPPARQCQPASAAAMAYHLIRCEAASIYVPARRSDDASLTLSSRNAVTFFRRKDRATTISS